jgi:hypothetical protein
MILDQELATGDPAGFAEEVFGGFAVVERVDEKNRVEAGVAKGEPLAIEGRHGDRGARPHAYVDTADVQARPSFPQPPGQGAVPAAHIQQRAPFGQEPFEMTREHFDAATVQPPGVDFFSRVHRRLIPSMLTKKPERIV